MEESRDIVAKCEELNIIVSIEGRKRNLTGKG